MLLGLPTKNQEVQDFIAQAPWLIKGVEIEKFYKWGRKGACTIKLFLAVASIK